MELTKLKKMSINIMIGSLIGSAAIAVIAVLVGEFNDTFSKALFTLLIVTLHALISLSFLDNRIKGNSTADLKIFTNTIFILIVLSFITAVFGIWELLPGELILRLYGTYGIAAFAILHGEMLHKTTGLDKKISNVVYSNYILMALVVGLLLPIVWIDTSSVSLPGMYYRILAAAAIVDTTLTILTVILHKLYLQKHPEIRSQLFVPLAYVVDANGNKIPQVAQAPRRTMHPLLVILLIYLALQLVFPFIFLMI